MKSERDFVMKLFFILVILSIPALVIGHYISLHKKNKQLMDEMEQPVNIPDVDSVYATVLKKDVAMEKNVVTPEKIVHSHRLVYGVQFLTEDNKTVEYDVSADLYDELYPGQKGILATVNGQFFDFGHGENI